MSRYPDPAPLPPAIANRLIADNPHEPLFPTLRAFGRGRPGVTQERADRWVIRDHGGCVVGGARAADVGPSHPVALDVAIDPNRKGEGFATALYAPLGETGIDVEAASAASLAHRLMTAGGYRFMRARRSRTDPDAESKMVATANICPGCGPL